MNTGTRLTLLQSKGLNRYAIKTGSGWVEETVSGDGPPVRRELSSRRVAIMIDALLSIQRDIDPLDTGIGGYTSADPFLPSLQEQMLDEMPF